MLPTLPPHVPRTDDPVRPEFLTFKASRYLVGVALALGVIWVGPAKEVLGPVPVGPPLEVLQRGTTSAMDPVPVLASIVTAALPPPAPNQLKAPCDPDLEEEINGYCWTPLAVERCPAEKSCYTHKGRYYQRVLRVQRVPQSGEVRAGNVAGEP